jgi:hypothetical protein
MSGDEGTWYELQPDSGPVPDAERYRDRAKAEQAAMAMLSRQPDLQFIEIAEYELAGGESSLLRTVSRIAGAQPPAPAEGEVDDLHLLPRGDPEC